MVTETFFCDLVSILQNFLILIETMEGNRFGGYTSDNFVPMSVGLISTSVDIQKSDDVALLVKCYKEKLSISILCLFK